MTKESVLTAFLASSRLCRTFHGPDRVDAVDHPHSWASLPETTATGLEPDIRPCPYDHEGTALTHQHDRGDALRIARPA